MAGSAFKDARVVEMSKSFDTVLVDCDSQSELADQYSIQVQPTVIYAASDGTALVTTLDAVGADEVLSEMQSALEHLKKPDAPK